MAASHTYSCERERLVPNRPDSPDGFRVNLNTYTSENGFCQEFTGWFEDFEDVKKLCAFWETGGAAMIRLAANLEPGEG